MFRRLETRGRALPLALLSMSLCLCGCRNYEFKEARRESGKYDLSKLTAELEKRKAKPAPLISISWFPLVHMETLVFSREGESSAPSMNFQAMGSYPPGYRFSEGTFWGPLGAYFSVRDSLYDTSGKGYEVVEMRSVLSRLWMQTRSLVKTPHGTREENRHDILFGLFPVYHEVEYTDSGEEEKGAGAN